ncbi:hypothetical protein [Providencia hangzhouensis]|uniref:hypothetical protein n=1 Tax=Providencia hangzhouensis TaxID=3031799 RepID=UPI0034DD1332
MYAFSYVNYLPQSELGVFPLMAIDDVDDDGTMAATYSGELFDCRQGLIKLIASSNHALILVERVTTDKLDLFIDRSEGDKLMIQLSDKSQKPSNESPGAGMLGWDGIKCSSH